MPGGLQCNDVGREVEMGLVAPRHDQSPAVAGADVSQLVCTPNANSHLSGMISVIKVCLAAKTFLFRAGPLDEEPLLTHYIDQIALDVSVPIDVVPTPSKTFHKLMN